MIKSLAFAMVVIMLAFTLLYPLESGGEVVVDEARLLFPDIASNGSAWKMNDTLVRNILQDGRCPVDLATWLPVKPYQVQRVQALAMKDNSVAVLFRVNGCILLMLYKDKDIEGHPPTAGNNYTRSVMRELLDAIWVSRDPHININAIDWSLVLNNSELALVLLDSHTTSSQSFLSLKVFGAYKGRWILRYQGPQLITEQYSVRGKQCGDEYKPSVIEWAGSMQGYHNLRLVIHESRWCKDSKGNRTDMGVGVFSTRLKFDPATQRYKGSIRYLDQRMSKRLGR